MSSTTRTPPVLFGRNLKKKPIVDFSKETETKYNKCAGSIHTDKKTKTMHLVVAGKLEKSSAILSYCPVGKYMYYITKDIIYKVCPLPHPTSKW